MSYPLDMKDRILALCDLVEIRLSRKEDNLKMELAPPSNLKGEISWQQAVQRRTNIERSALEVIGHAGYSPGETADRQLIHSVLEMQKTHKRNRRATADDFRSGTITRDSLKYIRDWVNAAI